MRCLFLSSDYDIRLECDRRVKGVDSGAFVRTKESVRWEQVWRSGCRLQAAKCRRVFMDSRTVLLSDDCRVLIGKLTYKAGESWEIAVCQ
jgi:hypothetical protein